MRWLFLIILLIAVPAFGGDQTFTCKVDSVYDFDVETAAIKEATGGWRDDIGTSFAVDRETGAVVGEYLNSRKAGDGQPIIISWGSIDPRNPGKSNWEAFWYTIGTGSTIFYRLEIYEFVEGEKKPFVFYKDDFYYTGFCE